MRFTKMHGTGNDYVYVDCFQRKVSRRSGRLARRIADRHFGVGGDGLIFICPSTVADARMRMFNADGSEAEMCGNGVRCVAKYVYDHGSGRRPTIEDRNGARRADARRRDRRWQGRRACALTWASRFWKPARFPVDLAGSAAWSMCRWRRIQFAGELPDWMDECGLDPRMTCVSMGNPHVVLFCGDVAAVPLEQVGPELETHADLSQAYQRAFRASSFAGRSDDAHLGARQRHHAGLRHRRFGGVRGRRADQRTAADPGPFARRRLGTALGGRWPGVHDGTGDRGVFGRVAVSAARRGHGWIAPREVEWMQGAGSELWQGSRR